MRFSDRVTLTNESDKNGPFLNNTGVHEMIEEYSTTDIQSSTLKLLQETGELGDIATVEI